MTNNFNNISPLDNRYSSKIENVRANFSEFALIKIRFEIEIDWIIYLCTNKPNLFKKISDASIRNLKNLKIILMMIMLQKLKKSSQSLIMM